MLTTNAGSRQVVFRADAGITTGGGHVARCLCLAETLVHRGWTSTLVTSADGSALMPDRARDTWRVIEIDQRNAADPESIILAVPDPADLLVIDHYGLGAEFERACRPWARRLAVFDDLPGRDHDCDILIDQTTGRRPSEYAKAVRADAAVLAGSQYALVASAFRDRRSLAMRRRNDARAAKSLVISVGATDPYNISGQVLNELAAIDWFWPITVILSHSAPHLASVQQQVAAQPSSRLLVGPEADEIAAVLLEADLSIGAGGTSTWERCCLGLPSIVLVVADNQQDIAAALAEAGAAIVLGRPKTLEPGAIAAAALALARDQELLRRMAHCAAALCDGEGAERVANVIEYGSSECLQQLA
jgi:UDP-2,4-diacetamido-2,4,6-trideoxy-beta-L-altropyranose hydrolase